MALVVEVMGGVLQGQKFLLSIGVKIGRSRGDIQIQDSKASGLHAQVEADEKGQLILRDLNSANGIVINDRKVKKVTLLPGVSFSIGRIPFKVFQIAEENVDKYIQHKNWRIALKDSLSELEIRNSPDTKLSLSSFNPNLVIEFVEGPQAETKLVLGYGPRDVGRDQMDIALFDSDSPPLAFTLQPTLKNGATIINRAGTYVMINSRPFTSHVIKSGDLIQVGKTKLLLRFE